MKTKNVVLIVLGIIALAFPLVVRSDYYQHLVIIALMWVAIGSAWNLRSAGAIYSRLQVGHIGKRFIVVRTLS